MNLELLKTLAAEASPGPWTQGDYGVIHNGQEGVAMGYAGNKKLLANAAFIVAACNAILHLVQRLEERETEFRSIHDRLEDARFMCSLKDREIADLKAQLRMKR